MRSIKIRQTGASLMEVLIAMSISLVVTASMIALMANSLGTTGRIVKMTKLADDLRVTMQMVSRDVRRSNFNGRSLFCYGNDECALDDEDAPKTVTDDEGNPLLDDEGNPLILAAAIDFKDFDNDFIDDDNCFAFQMDRDLTGDASVAAAGGFRRVTDPLLGVDVIEMWTGGAPAPDESICDIDAGWVQITDPGVLEITDFSINDSLSYTEVIQTNADGTPKILQDVRKLRISLRGRLLLDPNIERHLEDVISVRNNLLRKPTPIT
jgi:hypothetical protein